MQVFMQIFYLGLCACSFMCLYRIGRGPSAPDRTVAIANGAGSMAAKAIIMIPPHRVGTGVQPCVCQSCAS